MKEIIKDWLKTHDDLDGLFTNRANFDYPQTENVDLSILRPLWAFQVFGGTQGRKFQIRKLNKLEGSCLPGTRYELEIVYTIYDCFGNGQSDARKWYFPGLVELWVLQHYRNYVDYDLPPCYLPISNHSLTMIDKSIICVH